MKVSIPEELFHKPREGSTGSILSLGLVARKPVEWKYLVPSKFRNTPIVWLKENYKKGDIVVDTTMLDVRLLHRLRLKDVRWWFYTGNIPPEALDLR